MKALTLLFTLSFGFAFHAAAQTFTYNPTQDAFVSANNPTANYGAAGALAVAGTGDANGEFDSVLQFNLSTAAGLSIQSIKLQFNTTSPNNPLFNSPAASGTFGIVWMDNNSWTEGNGTPNTPSTDGGITYSTLSSFLDSGDETLGTYSFTAATSGSNIYSLSLAAPSFLSAVTSGDDVSFEILPSAGSDIAYLFNSENFGTAADRPMLMVQAVPEPGSFTLAIPGLLALAAFKRSRTRKALP